VTSVNDPSACQKTYSSPFSARYSSPEMSALFSPYQKALTFRLLWIELAKAEKKCGLPIQAEQIAEMETHLEQVDFDRIETYEKKFRHDVMAHIHAFGDLCPKAKPILHLGATSSFVTDNTDLLLLKQGMELLLQKMLSLLHLGASLAEKYAANPTLSYTHFQPAQPTTIGKRISLWLQDFLEDAKEWQRLIATLPFLGIKGATGTQASFLHLFDGDSEKVLLLENELAEALGFEKVIPIAGQTYPRKIDIQVLGSIASFAASAHKFATDFRLLAHEGEMMEPFAESQVGSSAMPYKRNPIYSERICGLARFAISIAQNPAYTLATQWLERSLDDSSNRRLVLPEAFLCADSILNLIHHILSAPHINTALAQLRCEQQLPQLCMEPILMASAKKGGDRQTLHEALRKLSLQGLPFDALCSEVEKTAAFRLSKEEVLHLADLKVLIGRAAEQAHLFLEREVFPFLSLFPKTDFKRQIDY
jgi:adenylosuccinate lyase